MALADLTDPNAVRAAIEEYRRRGEADFLAHYRFRPARSYFLIDGGARFPSKAIAGAAHGYQFPALGPLTAEDFSGGEATVRRKLEDLGFEIVVVNAEADAERVAALNWFHKRAGAVTEWPRVETEGMQLATAAKGIYKPAGSEFALSIRIALNGPYPDAPEIRGDGGWTIRYHEERKSGAAEPYGNQGLVRCMDAGAPIGVMLQLRRKPEAQYRVLGLGLITERAHGVFVVEGPVTPEGEYEFAEPARQMRGADPIGEADPPDLSADARRRIAAEVVRRQGQGQFRRKLMAAYEGACAISGCDIPDVLEAAHIAPYRGVHSNHVTNGLLLRADLHTLFDLGLITIDADNMAVSIAAAAQRSALYGPLHGRPLRLPVRKEEHPSVAALSERALLFSA